jgi:hypothetical protein
MARYFVSYDLNGNVPTHAQMDAHIAKLFPNRQRVLETVWFICGTDDRQAVYNHINAILSQNDRLLVIQANGAIWRNLLGGDLLANWNACPQ